MGALKRMPLRGGEDVRFGIVEEGSGRAAFDRFGVKSSPTVRAIVGTKAHSFPADRTLVAGSIEAWVTELMSSSVVSANARSLRVEVRRSGWMATVATVALLAVFASLVVALRRRTRFVALPAVKQPLLCDEV